MLKRVIHIMLIALFAIGTSGYSLFIHHCHNRLVSVAVNHPAKTCCGDVCDQCKDDHITYQIKDDFKSFTVEFKPHFDYKLIQFAIIRLDLPEINPVKKGIENIEDSPPGILAPTLPFLKTIRC